MNTACFAWRLQNSGTSDPGLLSVWAAVCMAGAVFWDTSATGVRLRAWFSVAGAILSDLLT